MGQCCSTSETKRAKMVEHSGHPQHKLVLKHDSALYTCSGCQELGSGICYWCKKCKFYLHKECGMPSSPTSHPFLDTCIFTFHLEPPASSGAVCSACLGEVKGYMYQCQHQRPHTLHPLCAKLPLELPAADGVNLAVKLKKKGSHKSECLKCKDKINPMFKFSKEWSYVSDCGKFCFHVACVKEMMHKTTSINDQITKKNKKDEVIGKLSDAVVKIDAADLAQQIAASLPSNQMVKREDSSSTGGTAAKILEIIVAVLTAILPAILGDANRSTAVIELIGLVAKSMSSSS